MTKLDELKARFLVDEPPPMLMRCRRVFAAPSPRPLAPKPGKQLLQWIIEETDEQLQLGVRVPQIRVTRRDLTHLQYLLQWIDGKEREADPDARPQTKETD